MKLKPATTLDKDFIKVSIDSLKWVRNRLKKAGAPKAARAVSRALKSAEGALRHVERRMRVK